MTLVEFLLARIAEDEAAAPREPIGRWQTTRVLVECEAKRQIIEGADLEIGPSTAEDWLLPLLALPYADHPDYDEGWRA